MLASWLELISVSLIVRDSFLLEVLSFLENISLGLELIDLSLLMRTNLFRFLETTFEILDFQCLIFSYRGFVIERVTSGFQSLNLNIFILRFYLPSIKLLNYPKIGCWNSIWFADIQIPLSFLHPGSGSPPRESRRWLAFSYVSRVSWLAAANWWWWGVHVTKTV